MYKSCIIQQTQTCSFYESAQFTLQKPSSNFSATYKNGAQFTKIQTCLFYESAQFTKVHNNLQKIIMFAQIRRQTWHDCSQNMPHNGIVVIVALSVRRTWGRTSRGDQVHHKPSSSTRARSRAAQGWVCSDSSVAVDRSRTLATILTVMSLLLILNNCQKTRR